MYTAPTITPLLVDDASLDTKAEIIASMAVQNTALLAFYNYLVTMATEKDIPNDLSLHFQKYIKRFYDNFVILTASVTDHTT